MEGMRMGTAEEGSDLAFESKVREAANKRKDHSKLAFKALAEDFPGGPLWKVTSRRSGGWAVVVKASGCMWGAP